MRPFLTATWKYLCMLNYEVRKEILAPYVPPFTELDSYENKFYLSVVGFLFHDTKVLGVRIPWHVNFEEINLRFYVKHQSALESRRGVVFIKEIVPRRAIALVARKIYEEPYIAIPTKHEIKMNADGSGRPNSIEYAWKYSDSWNSLSATPIGGARESQPGSLEEFITEHYWGYTKRSGGGTSEYKVEHPRWKLWDVSNATLVCDAAKLYGPKFEQVLASPPSCAFLAEGSAVKVYPGNFISA